MLRPVHTARYLLWLCCKQHGHNERDFLYTLIFNWLSNKRQCTGCTVPYTHQNIPLNLSFILLMSRPKQHSLSLARSRLQLWILWNVLHCVINLSAIIRVVKTTTILWQEFQERQFEKCEILLIIQWHPDHFNILLCVAGFILLVNAYVSHFFVLYIWG